MDNQNKVELPITIEKILIDFGDICRFCLCQTKSDISINDKCLSGKSAGLEEDTIFNFMTKLRFIKMENPNCFPTRICESCFDLIKLFYNFDQICQKSDSLLRNCYENSLKEGKEEFGHGVNKSQFNIFIKEPDTKGVYLLDCSTRLLLLKELNEVNDKYTNKFSQTQLTETFGILEMYKQKLNSISDRIKQAQSLILKTSLPLPASSTSEQSPHTCSQCSLKFNNIRALDFHLVTTHGQKRFTFQCKNCLKSFTSQKKLNRHCKLIHKICDSEFSLDYLNKSFTRLSQTEEKNFICFQCVPYKKLQSQDQLIEHFQESHEEKSSTSSKSYSCAHCNDSAFPSKISLNEHLVLAHNLKKDEITSNDVYCPVENSKPLKVLVSNPPPLNPKQFHNITDFSEFLDALCSIVDSLTIVQQEEGSGFKVLCKNCNPPSEFISAQDFINHMHTHQDGSKLLENWVIESETKKDGVWNCSECPASYIRKQSLYFHLREKHKRTNLGRIKCPEPDCVESFSTNHQLIRHGISVHQKYFACFHEVFRKIIQTTDEEEVKRIKNYECDICQRRYIYKTSLRKHVLTAHLGKSSKDNVVCSYCGKTVSSKLNLKSHIEFVHEALFVSCPICKKKINFKTIGKHYKTHKTNSDLVYSKNSFLCNLCGKILKSKRSFEDHQKLHKNVRDELCDICGSGFTTKKFLRLHKKIHDGVQRKIFNCNQCDKVFSGRHTLNRHLLTHSGEKNFICEICSKCFYTLQELNRHVRYHKKEYRFNCQLCDMRFLDKSRFRHHMMKHRNVRPHKCQFCEKMFIVRGKMHLHMASKHNVEVQNTKGIWKDPKTYVPLDDLL